MKRRHSAQLAISLLALFLLLAVPAGASVTVASPEAESFTLPSGMSRISGYGSSGGQFVGVQTASTATKSVSFSQPATQVTVRAAAEATCGGAPHYQVLIDGNVVAQGSVTTRLLPNSTWATSTNAVNVAAGTHTVGFRLDNYLGGSCGRSGYIDNVAFTGADSTTQPPPPTTQPASMLQSENVTTGAANNGDGGNTWGGHQSRMVRTSAGLFTAYTSQPSGADQYHKQWNLAWRYNGSWKVIATGPAGRDPMSLLADKNGKLWIIAWPPPWNAPQAWSGTPNTSNGTVSMSGPQVVPGNWLYTTYAGYMGAAVGPDGAVYAHVGFGADGTTEAFVFTRRDPATGTWTTNTVDTYALTGQHGRYNYGYILPESNGKGVWVIATRNENWSALGYSQPSGSFSYVYDRIEAFHTSDATVSKPTWTHTTVSYHPQSSTVPDPNLSAAWSGGMLDSGGRLHVLYRYTPNDGSVTPTIHHAVISPTGSVLSDSTVPGLTNGFARMVANGSGNLFVVGSTGGSKVNVYPVPDPTKGAVGTATTLDVGANVLYAGLMGADPRGGTASGNTWDFGFPSGTSGEIWRYARMQLPTS